MATDATLVETRIPENSAAGSRLRHGSKGDRATGAALSAYGPKADHVAFGAAPGIAFGRGL
jgi:hypothetical protein